MMEKAKSRAAVIGRLVIKGSLALASPLLIGTGESDGFTDQLVLKNKADFPYIPGSSLAGALRALFPAEAEYFGIMEEGKNGRENDCQSSIITADIPLENARLVIRDSVRIAADTGIAVDGAKFDYEAVERGATGDFRIIATVREYQREKWQDIIGFCRRLGGAILSGICLGAHTTKGFGQIVGKKGTVSLDVYDFSEGKAVAAWLGGKSSPQSEILEAADAVSETDCRIFCRFAINSSLLVRSHDSDEVERTKEKYKLSGEGIASMLKSGDSFVIPGASWRGVLRHRAERIFRILGKDAVCLNDLFGYVEANGKGAKKSRFAVSESYIKNPAAKENYQMRNRIDRFTGATVDGALFADVPIWQNAADDTPTVDLEIRIRRAEKWEEGLLLCLLKDLWTGNLAVGGGKSVGRGNLRGLAAEIVLAGNNGEKISIKRKENRLEISGNREKLEAAIKALNDFCGKKAKEG